MPANSTLSRTPPSIPVLEPLRLTDERRYAWLLTLAYFCVAAFGVLHHEMWRDEWQAWMLARDSGSIAELLYNMQHEGHPPAWYLVLFALSRVTRSPAALQTLNLLIATSSVFVLARFSRLPWLHRVLIAFGYFFVFEYGIIARAYSLTVLALFGVCALFRAHRRYAVPLVGSLVVLATVSVYGLIIAIAISLALLYDRIGERRVIRRLRELHINWKILFLIGFVATAAAVFIMRPSEGFRQITLPPARFTPWTMAESAGTLTWGYLPLPDVRQPHIWNTHILPQVGRNWIALRASLAVMLLTAGVLLFARYPAVLILYVVATGGLGLFQHLFFVGTLRHHGHYFIVFIACLWLAHDPLRRWRLPAGLRRVVGVRHAVARTFVLALLVVHCVAGVVLYASDLGRPFSAAPMAAQTIIDSGLRGAPIAVSPAPAGSVLAGILDRPVYYIAAQMESTFLPWGQYRSERDRTPDMSLIRSFLDESPLGAVVIVLARPLERWDEDLEVREVARHEPGLERTEGFVIYAVTRQPTS